MMKPEIKAKWVAALKSGEYTQGHGLLRNADDNTFCCLGVLCDIHAKETGSKWEQTGRPEVLRYEDSFLMLPDIVIDWAGLLNNNPSLNGITCSRHNDGEATNAKTFPEIADLIEANL